MDRRALVERAGRGDHDAFAVLATAAAPRLDAAARLILRDPELARDAVQNTLVRAWRDLPGLRDPDRFDAWLHRLLVNSCLDEARRRRRRPIEVEIKADRRAVRAPTRPATLADRDLVERALIRLDPEHRALVVLHYYLGYPLPEAATSLGISLPAAKSRLHRAMQGLRRSMAADPGRPAWKEGGRHDRLRPVRPLRAPDQRRDRRDRRRRARPTTSTTSSGRPRARRSGLAGPSPKGGSPWIPRSRGRRSSAGGPDPAC